MGQKVGSYAGFVKVDYRTHVESQNDELFVCQFCGGEKNGIKTDISLTYSLLKGKSLGGFQL